MSADHAEMPERRLAALEAELEAIKDEVRSLRAVQTQLIRDSALAQRDPSDRLQNLATALEALAYRLGELEQRVGERESDPLAALSGQRDPTLHRLTEDVAMLKQSRDDAVSEFSLLRQGWKVLDKRLRKLEEQEPASPSAPTPSPPPPVTQPPRLSVTQPTRTVSRIVAPLGRSPIPSQSPPASTRSPAPSQSSAPPVAEHTPAADALTVVHAEEQAPLQDAVRTTLGKWMMHYASIDEPPPTGRSLLMINLLLAQADPLALLQAGAQGGSRAVFVYCADNTHGVAFGLIDCFPPVFDPATCAARLSERSERVQRLLVVTENVEAATALKNQLSATGCTTSMAFDGRQALDLVRMVRPDLALVDLGLPKGQGLQTAARLRVDPKYPRLQLSFLWNTPIRPAEFRLDAQRAIRDFPFGPDDLTRAMTRFLNPAVSGAFPTFDRL